MQTVSHRNWRLSAARLIAVTLTAASLQACSNVSDELKAARAKADSVAVKETPPVVVAAPAEPTKLPDIPADVHKCLGKEAKTDGKTADEKVTALLLSDRTKAKCYATLFRWYRERQAAVAKQAEAVPKGHPRTVARSKQPAPNWD